MPRQNRHTGTQAYIHLMFTLCIAGVLPPQKTLTMHSWCPPPPQPGVRGNSATVMTIYCIFYTICIYVCVCSDDNMRIHIWYKAGHVEGILECTTVDTTEYCTLNCKLHTAFTTFIWRLTSLSLTFHFVMEYICIILFITVLKLMLDELAQLQ
jgi:hypothetical protein